MTSFQKSPSTQLSLNAKIIMAPSLQVTYSHSERLLLVATSTWHGRERNLRIDGWRPNTLPRTVNVDKDSYRFLAGLRGTTASNWDWETALVYSKSESSDATSNRINLKCTQNRIEQHGFIGIQYLQSGFLGKQQPEYPSGHKQR